MNQNVRGSLLVNVKITIPTNLTFEQHEGLTNLFISQ
jgi:DnaJ-class molecular chaperone